MIPKVIHYCWFGGKPLPQSAQRCIASWRQFLPGYEIKEWNEGNFDVHAIPYIDEAYRAKKYAFVSDYARLQILYNEGGLYFDTDVELIKPIDDILAAGPFMGMERNPDENGQGLAVAAGLGLAIDKGNAVYKMILEKYADLHFMDERGHIITKTIVQYVTEWLLEAGLKVHSGILDFQGIKIYPRDYFNPKDALRNVITITENTRSIHHFAYSWSSFRSRVIVWVYRWMGRLPCLVLSCLWRNPIEYPRMMMKVMRKVCGK